MSDAKATPKHPLSTIELGVIVTVILAIMAGVYYIGQFETRLSLLEAQRDDFRKNVDESAKLLTDTETLIDEAATRNSVPVGTIVASYLAPDAFITKSGDQWTPADGSDCPKECAYYLENGKPELLPDLRGQFIRGLNRFNDETGDRKDGKEDADGIGRIAGSFQPDEVISHNHKLTAASSSHFSAGDSAGPRTSTAREAYAAPYGGKETRPRNTAVYFYIKIR